MSLLTTITPYWGRPEMLLGWVRALRDAAIPEVRHHIYFINENKPHWWDEEIGGAIDEKQNLAITSELRETFSPFSIGHFHNLGIQAATTPWVMKLDVDTIPNEGFFKSLIPWLEGAKHREWFNCGMLCLNQQTTVRLNSSSLTVGAYIDILNNRRECVVGSYLAPTGTNFICRRQDYLDCGGCDERFQGYGWEDYQQIHALEFQQQGMEPLLGETTLENVTQRCRDEISRPKALDLYRKSLHLCLLHRWHPQSNNSNYRTLASMQRNRYILLDNIRGDRYEAPEIGSVE